VCPDVRDRAAIGRSDEIAIFRLIYQIVPHANRKFTGWRIIQKIFIGSATRGRPLSLEPRAECSAKWLSQAKAPVREIKSFGNSSLCEQRPPGGSNGDVAHWPECRR